ncbi:MAG: helix-turn-helix transcriptional regulator [Kofleriaceae bacterium]|nr:helix-turn-helix transcriptional regulator [Kofleriaceae bacterium]
MDASRLSAALTDFYAPGLAADTYVERAFALTARLLPFSLNSHGVLDKRTGVLSANFDAAPAGLADAFAAFGRLMGKYPVFSFDPSVNGGKPYSARDFYSRPSLQDLDIYQEVYRPMGFADHCFVHVPAGPEEVVVHGFMRESKAFDQREKAVLEILQPHLANGRALALLVTEAKDLPVAPELFAHAGFTPRECDVLFWLTRGKTNHEIAKTLQLRDDSVSRHLQAIYSKLAVDHRVAAVLAGLALARRLHAELCATRGGVELAVATR